MSDSYWEDLGSALVQVGADLALAAAVQSAFGGSKKQDSSQTVAVQEPVNAALIWVGGWSKDAGDKVFHETQPSNISNFFTVQALADHRLEFGDIYLNNDIAIINSSGTVTDVLKVANRDGRYQDNHVFIHKREGLPTETPYTDSDANLIAAFPGMLDSSFRGDGTASILMKTNLPTAGFRIQEFPNGHPDLSVVARNKAIFDWRDGTQDRTNQATWKPCANPVVNWVFLEWYRWGRDWARCIAPVLSELTDEANYCDGLVAKAGGGYEPRYEVAFRFRADEDRDSVRARLKASMDGFFTTDGLGRLVIRAGRYDAPTDVIPGQYVEGCDWQRGVDPDKRFDRLIVTYTRPDAAYNTDNTDDWVVGGGSKTQPFDATMVTAWRQARRLAKRAVPRLMPAGSGTINLGVYGINWFLPDADGKRCKRYIMVDYPDEPTMSNVPLEVLDVEDDPFGQGFIFTVAAADPNIDAWNAAAEEGLAPSDLQLT